MSKTANPEGCARHEHEVDGSFFLEKLFTKSKKQYRI